MLRGKIAITEETKGCFLDNEMVNYYRVKKREVPYFEVNASRRWAFSGGCQYNGINYDFKSGKSTYPLDTELKSPNGSAINVVFGAYYCF